MNSPVNDGLDAALRQLLVAEAEAIAADWRQRLRACGGNHANGLTPEAELAEEMRSMLAGLREVLAAPGGRLDLDAEHPLARTLRSASQVRAARGFSPEESVLFAQTCKESLVAQVHAHPDAVGDVRAASARVDRLLDRCVLTLVSGFVAAREAVIRRQSESLREVSTPVIALWDSILLLPLVGVVDSVRAQHISERLLMAIGESEAEVTLIDVTGVPVMDTSVARHILKTVAAAEMLGTRVVLTGISPSTAQTMVKLGIDMTGVPTRGSLKTGMALALTLTGHRIVSAVPAAGA